MNRTAETKSKIVTFSGHCARRRSGYHGSCNYSCCATVSRSNAARPLTPKGRRQLRKIGAAIKKLEPDFDLILSSPFMRARQTAEIVAASLKLKKCLKFSNALASGGAPSILIRQLEREKPAPEKILLVGHEPDLSQLVSLLTTGGPHLELDFKKAGLCKVEAGKLRPGKCATLAWLLTPKQMRQMV
jgi:phosphohistidine phosphatase